MEKITTYLITLRWLECEIKVQENESPLIRVYSIVALRNTAEIVEVAEELKTIMDEITGLENRGEINTKLPF